LPRRQNRRLHLPPALALEAREMRQGGYRPASQIFMVLSYEAETIRFPSGL
jgi:hypothetical protein